MIGQLIDKILSLHPWVEVGIKFLYWRCGPLNRLLRRVLSKLRRPQQAAAVEAIDATLLPQIIERLRQSGIGPGDLVIVHSSMGNLKKLGASPQQIIAALRELIGPSGTLAMPAFPLFPSSHADADYMSEAPIIEICEYDVQRTPCWTGIIGTTLMRMEGAVRSRHPINSLAAIGPLAADMMTRNIEGESPLGCGKQSAWAFCAEHGAKIVALGTDMAHSLTMIHVAEDAHEDTWPVKDWYRDRQYKIIDGAFSTLLACRERRPRWAIHYGERTLAKDLKRHAVLKSQNVGGVLIEQCDAKALLAFLDARKSQAYPYFLLPRTSKVRP